ncbi:hypothetical protein [Halobacteriovorax sp.]|uniref:hypothetical protein n=1 Tax=Halobacteriovorax sp. TaxID=2020862 RepID=UPI003564BAC9
MVKKKVISREQQRDMKGFEEIMDLVADDNEKLEIENQKKKSDKVNDSYQLYNFLEDESNRLEKLSQFFGTKISNFEDYNQTEYIKKKQSEQKTLVKSELAKFQSKENSPLNMHLGRLFNSLF